MNGGRSFDFKLDRAEHHLRETAGLIAEYNASEPYKVDKRAPAAAGGRPTFWLEFTAQPAPRIAMALGDFVHNLRSALDHLACALVPAEQRETMSFPVFFHGVWEPADDRDSQRRKDQRKRWQWCTRHMDPRAIDVLRRVQPPDNEGTDEEMDYGLRVVQYLDNRDKHRALPIVASGLVNTTGEMRGPDGRWRPARGALNQGETVTAGPIVVPQGVVDLRLQGTPLVMVDTGRRSGRLLIPGPFPTFLHEVRELAAWLRPLLAP